MGCDACLSAYVSAQPRAGLLSGSGVMSSLGVASKGVMVTSHPKREGSFWMAGVSVPPAGACAVPLLLQDVAVRVHVL